MSFLIHLDDDSLGPVCGEEYPTRREIKTVFIEYSDYITEFGITWTRCKDCMNTLTPMDYLNAIKL